MSAGGQAGGPPLAALGAWASFRHHWPEYVMEAAALGIFMISAGLFTVLLVHPESWAAQAVTSPFLRRVLIGLAMGGTAAALIYSPWGRRSGAHMNPAVTLAYLRLGKIPPWDAAFYILFQALGGLAGVLLTAGALGAAFTTAPVSYVVTVPGPLGAGVAFAGEWLIACLMMAMILVASNRPVLAPWTGAFAGGLIACFVTFESPLSGFGMNPARTLASAWPSGIWTAFAVYLTAAPLGMLVAAQGYRLLRPGPVECCKLHHDSRHRCIFCGRHVTRAFAAGP